MSRVFDSDAKVDSAFACSKFCIVADEIPDDIWSVNSVFQVSEIILTMTCPHLAHVWGGRRERPVLRERARIHELLDARADDHLVEEVTEPLAVEPLWRRAQADVDGLV